MNLLGCGQLRRKVSCALFLQVRTKESQKWFPLQYVLVCLAVGAACHREDQPRQRVPEGHLQATVGQKLQFTEKNFFLL